jgi:hypothetical protein
MYPRQLRMLCLFMALCLVLGPIGQARAQLLSGQASGSVTVPVAGTVVTSTGTSIGYFNGTFTINNFETLQSNQIVAVGMIRGSITNPANQVLQTGLHSLNLPVNLSQITGGLVNNAPVSITKPQVIPASYKPAAGARFTRVQFGSCGATSLQIAMGGGAAVSILGNNVVLSPVALNVSAAAGGTVTNLVCQILGSLGGLLNPTNLLNSLLGTITSLLRGTTGGLLGGIL